MSLDGELHIFALSGRGKDVARRIQAQLGGTLKLAQKLASPEPALQEQVYQGSIGSAVAVSFSSVKSLVLVLPVGVAVRLLAPLMVDKRSDPGVVVVDEAGRHAVALLSGHLGGANQLARQVAAAIGAQPVITTAAEALDLIALDLLGREWGWTSEDGSDLTRVSAVLLDGEPVAAFQDCGEEDWWQRAPSNLVRYASLDALERAPAAARLIISDRVAGRTGSGRPPSLILSSSQGLPLAGGRGQDGSEIPTVVIRPRSLIVGVGCVRGASADEIEAHLLETLESNHLAPASVRELATIDLKADEVGLQQVAATHGWPIRSYGAAELGRAATPSGASAAVLDAVGAGGVCEPAALLAAGAEHLVVPKTKTTRVTVAVARVVPDHSTGHLAVVGLGPGGQAELTQRAREILERADVVVGYHGYLDLVRPWLGSKQYHGSPIGEEVERCQLAISLARSGQRSALVSSGDAGIYGTAGLVLELLADEGADEEAAAVEIVPGVSAAQAAAALLGAPLMSDFTVLSLSDLMIPWSTIEKRIEAAAASDQVMALYNPASQKRRAQLARAQAILLQHRGEATPVGLVRNAGRAGQTVTLTNLGSLLEHSVDMLTMVIVGNSATIWVGGRMVTRRGYSTDGSSK